MDNSKMNNSKYVEYVNSHVEEIAKYVNDCFEESKDSIREELIEIISGYLTPIPTHYVHEDDDNPYDHSGVIVEDGDVSLDQTISDFLENEYSGNQEATFMSHMGWNYNTYGDELSDETIRIAGDIMFPAIKRYIEKHFNISLSDEEFEDIRFKCFDSIYDECIASDFFFVAPAIEFVNIGNIKLTDIVEKEEE